MRYIRPALVALCLMALPAHAETIDVGQATCKDVLELKNDELTSLLMWTHGYFGGQANDTTIDFKAFEEAGKVIGEYCGKNPDANWLESIEKLGK
jgi:acid stress chaperone HdeB